MRKSTRAFGGWRRPFTRPGPFFAAWFGSFGASATGFRTKECFEKLEKAGESVGICPCLPYLELFALADQAEPRQTAPPAKAERSLRLLQELGPRGGMRTPSVPFVFFTAFALLPLPPRCVCFKRWRHPAPAAPWHCSMSCLPCFQTKLPPCSIAPLQDLRAWQAEMQHNQHYQWSLVRLGSATDDAAQLPDKPRGEAKGKRRICSTICPMLEKVQRPKHSGFNSSTQDRSRIRKWRSWANRPLW